MYQHKLYKRLQKSYIKYIHGGLIMKRLTYRGAVYQKPEVPSIRETVSEESRTYRGIKFHYESKKKKVVA